MKIKGIQQRGENSYRFTVSCGFDGNGKHIRKTMTFKVPEGTSQAKTEKLVMEAYVDFSRRCKNSQDLDENMRFRELVEIYLNQYAENELKPVTRYNYRRDLENHMLPEYGNKKIKDITTRMLTEYFTGLDKSSETTRKFKIIMSSVFRYGVEQGYIKDNPCKGARYKKDTSQKNKIKHLNKEQCQKLMSATNEYSTINTIIQFLLFTGLRIGECLALHWSDIDFEHNTFTVQYTLSYADDMWFFSEPKTKTSHRTIKFGPHTKALLLRHKEEQDKLKEKVGDAWKYPDLVFTSVVGNFYCRSFTNKQLKKILEENDLPTLSVHGLRHSNASLMINDGVDIKAVSEWLGHCNIAVTGDIYAHIFDEYKSRIAESLEHDLAI